MEGTGAQGTVAVRATVGDTGGMRSGSGETRVSGERDPQIRAAVRRVRAGDAEAVRFLYVRLHKAVRLQAFAVLRDHHEAEDVAQSVFVKVLATRLSSYDDRTAPLRTWLMQVARNLAIDHARRRRAVPVAEVPDAAAPGSGPDANTGDDIALRGALDELPGGQAEVMVMHHVLGLTAQEIAERTGRTPVAVNALERGARSALQSALGTREATRRRERARGLRDARIPGAARSPWRNSWVAS